MMSLLSSPRGRVRLGLATLLASLSIACLGESIPRLIVAVPAHSVSKLPFVIAQDQGLYAKHGVNVELWLPAPGAPDSAAVHAEWWIRVCRAIGIGTPREAEVEVDGAGPAIVRMAQERGADSRISIAGTDCVVRAHVVARKGLASLDDLKGHRIGVTSLRGTSGFHALLLAQRMGWDPRADISIVPDADGVERLQDGSVDATMAYEEDYAKAVRAGLPVLADTQLWNESLAGNSVRVHRQWLADPERRETARRFLKAVAEAIAVMHREPEVALDVMAEWYGMTDRAFARDYLSRGAWISREPYPCVEGIRRTMALYDSDEMRRHTAAEFYDDSLMREIAESGFIEELYREN